MSVGFIMLAHTALERAGEVALHLAASGATVVIHVDKRTPDFEFHRLVAQVSGNTAIHFAPRIRCDWGTWSLVEATRTSARMLLSLDADARHVALVSGACLPIKSVEALRAHLDANRDTDFIESVTIDEVPWAKDGLGPERFTMTFPFPWKRRKRLFDAWVSIQRRFGLSRPIPADLTPHMGSQWWCLTRKTLSAILDDPDRARFNAYFRSVWIPDESYFATLARRHARQIVSRSLTLSKFDFQGNPHVFYDDHLAFLRQSSAFFARKIWPGARKLYGAFLGQPLLASDHDSVPSEVHIDRVFAEAVARRTRGRAGLSFAGRFPRPGHDIVPSADRYTVFHGFGDTYRNFPAWSEETLGLRTHGHLFAPERAEFAEGLSEYVGGLSDRASLRDYNPDGFLTNLIWNSRGEHQAFLFGPRDNADITDLLARDPNATVFAVSGAWAIPLLSQGRSAEELRGEAARLQARETAVLARLSERRTRARVFVWTLAEVLDNPAGPLKAMLDEVSVTSARTLRTRPEMKPIDGIADFLQALRNIGMNPHSAGDVSDRHGRQGGVSRQQSKRA